MNTKLFILLATLQSAGLLCQETTKTPVTKVIFKMSPQHLTRNTLKAGTEFFNTTHTKSYSVYLLAVANNKSHDPYDFSNPYNGVGAEFQFRKYLNPFQYYETKRGKPYFQGVYFGGFIQSGSYKGDFDYESQEFNPQTSTFETHTYKYSRSAQNLAVGFTIGVQRTLWKVLTLDGFVGAGYQASKAKATGTYPTSGYFGYSLNIDDPGYYGILPKIGLQIGVAL